MVDWFYIGYCIVMAMFAVAAAYAAVVGLRALRRLPRSLMVGFAAAAVVATLTAQKTNNVPPNMNQPQMMQGGGPFQTGFTGLTGLVGIGNLISLVNPVQTTIDDIIRGWRVESVTTNAAVSYAMPTNAALVGNWHIHGAASSFGNNVVDFGFLRTSGTLVPTNWSFPLGTNNEAFSSFWYFVDGRIRPTPRDTAHEICAVGVPMSAVPGQSRLWRLAGEDGVRILTWESFFLGGDTNCPVNAQIILSPNGDFLTRSNDVETVCRRINPDDWDDDGIHNERDANPASYDGDFFDAANGLPANANPDAYYWLDLSVTGLLGVAVPADVTNHWRDVETVIFAGCSVLDIGDKGNHYSNPASHSASPGLKWATLSGASALLGYCWKAPLDNQGGVQIINSWCANRSSLGDVAAWMRANDNMNGRNACAIRLLQGGKIEYRYFRRDGRGWNLRSKYLEIVEEINL